MEGKRYIKSDLSVEETEELFCEISGKKKVSENEMFTIDAFFAKDENNVLSLYFYDSAQRQEIINNTNNGNKTKGMSGLQ